MEWIDQVPVESGSTIPGIHPFVHQFLARKGITTEGQILAFINPDVYTPTSGYEIPGLGMAVERIALALERKESICVWGDFDADGQTSTALLVQTIVALGGNVQYHIPVRAAESHGVNILNLKRILDGGVDLIVTCDTGISAHEAAEYSKARNVDFVVTDHHDLPDRLPNATAITNPKFLSAGHPLEGLSGVGIAYKVAEALIRHRNADFNPEDLLDLVALGMIADLAALTFDSRYLVQKGLDRLNKTHRLGLKTMMALSDINPPYLNEEHVGFVLAPRLNALGRLGDANPAVELLTTEDPVRAKVLSTQLEGLNVQRKLLCDQVVKSAEEQLLKDTSLRNQPVIILSHPKWPGGVVGIAASTLVERHGKPAILFSCPEGEPARGSARSIDGINITEAISRQKDILLGFGGHPMAAGLSLEAEKLPEFKRRINEVIMTLAGEVLFKEKTINIDGWINLEDINDEFSAEIEKLAPFGTGNNKPFFAIQGLSIKDVAEIGKNKEHLKISVVNENNNSQTVLWWDGVKEDLPSSKFDLAFSLRASNWKGVRQSQLVWINSRSAESDITVISDKKPQIIDFRFNDNQLEKLQSLGSETQIWAEGPGRKSVHGITRLQLSPGNSLAVWSIPPSLDVFRQALKLVRPECLYLFAQDPKMDDAGGLLDRLAGMIKYAIGHKSGRSSLSELAAECSQTPKGIKKGLDALVSQGQITVQYETPDLLKLSFTKEAKSSGHFPTLERELRELLLETASYRKYYLSAKLDSLIP